MLELEDRVCSLELSKKLEELGVKQESSYYWVRIVGTAENPGFGCKLEFNDGNNKYTSKVGISAFTVAELGELLPNYIDGEELQCSKDVDNNWWVQYVRNDGSDVVSFKSRTEADARAKMLIYLLENKLISLEEVNKGL